MFHIISLALRRYVKKYGSESLESLKSSKKLKNETFYFMNFQKRRDFVNLSRAFLKSSNQ